ncbi:MAG: extracellular solute-binding protein [Actinomycetota bacterium]|nr:extracellular solute-binding protein [Actinomycetota bacterium]
MKTQRCSLNWLGLALGLLLVASACQAPGEPAAQQTTVSAAAPPTAPAEEEPVTTQAADGEAVTISIAENAIRGGKNTVTAEWLLDWAIPTFEEQMSAEGRNVQVEFIEAGVDDEDYKARLALDLSVGEGADVIGFDSFWLSEFVAADLLRPLSEVVGPEAEEWEGWDVIPEAVAGSLVIEDQRYGIPLGTDGRVLFFRKDIFAEAGLQEDWQPTSWDEILEAGRTIQEALPDVTPLQFNAGTSMGEATTLQGFIPILLGTGEEPYLFEQDAWLGNSPALQEALGFFNTVYSEGLGNVDLQLRADGRDRSFAQFSEGTIALLAESDYLWRGVVAPDANFPIENREEVVGWAKIPAMQPGTGIRGQDFVSASGGTGRVLNPNTQHPQEAWEFLSFLGSEEALTNFVELEPRITARTDVNETAIADDPMLSYIAEEVLPITWYRPGFEEYPQVSEAIQLMVENVVAGRSTIEEAAQAYQAELERIAGAENVASTTD